MTRPWREEVATAVRTVEIGPFGPNARAVIEIGGQVALTPDECHEITNVVLAKITDLLRSDEVREAVARAMAIHDDYDGCFERLDGTDDEEPMSTDQEDADWWCERSTAALAVLREMVGGA
jgi:hypothetical protein